jgi:Domain of unknown function (DUF4287)/Domain of unknown function (DUF5655)
MYMTFQAYLDTIKEKTGKTPEDFKALAEKKGLLTDGVKAGPIVAWLQQDYGLGRGHAMAIVQTLRDATLPKVTSQDRLAARFAGEKARWREPFDALVTKLNAFGPQMAISPTDSYISLLHKNHKFAIVQVTGARLDIGVKLKGVAPTDRFESADGWNNMVTHRVRVNDPGQIDNEVLEWLKRAYESA